MRKKVLQYRIISKDRRFRSKVVLILVLIPRTMLLPNTETLPVPLKRLQFLVRLAFAMTINKSQGQSVEHVVINLQISVFLHEQLYVAFSRCISPLNISVLFPECHKLHSAISPSILHRFSRSQWLRKALEKTFQSVPVTSRGDQ